MTSEPTPTTPRTAEKLEQIRAQLQKHNKRSRQVISELIEIKKRPKPAEESVAELAPDEKAARELAMGLMNGDVELPLVAPVDRERTLLREKRAIEIVLDLLNREYGRLLDVLAGEWEEAHRDVWSATCREIMLGAIRLEALEDFARRLINTCPNIFILRLPLAHVIGGGRSVADESEVDFPNLVEEAKAKGVITSGEIREARKV